MYDYFHSIYFPGNRESFTFRCCVAEVWPYIEKIKGKVRDLESRHQKAKDNLLQIEQLGDTWKVSPFLQLVTQYDS